MITPEQAEQAQQIFNEYNTQVKKSNVAPGDTDILLKDMAPVFDKLWEAPVGSFIAFYSELQRVLRDRVIKELNKCTQEHKEKAENIIYLEKFLDSLGA